MKKSKIFITVMLLAAVLFLSSCQADRPKENSTPGSQKVSGEKADTPPVAENPPAGKEDMGQDKSPEEKLAILEAENRMLKAESPDVALQKAKEDLKKREDVIIQLPELLTKYDALKEETILLSEKGVNPADYEKKAAEIMEKEAASEKSPVKEETVEEKIKRLEKENAELKGNSPLNRDEMKVKDDLIRVISDINEIDSKLPAVKELQRNIRKQAIVADLMRRDVFKDEE